MSTLILAAALLLLALCLTPFLPPKKTLLIDLPSHFVPQYAAAALVLLVPAYIFHASHAFIPLFAAFIASGAQLLPFHPGAPAAGRGKPLKILQANVLKTNKNAEPLLRLIAAEAPDIVACAEVAPVFAEMLKGLAGAYPHQLVSPGKSEYGMAVLSRLPFLKAEQAAFDGARTEALVFRVEHEGKAVDAVSLHPANPLFSLESRDNEFAGVAARFADEKPERLLLIGDFNATPWCPALKRLVKALGLRYARAGRGILPSWPCVLRLPILRIPIDHVLAGGALQAGDFRLGPPIGSDHLPTLTTIYLK